MVLQSPNDVIQKMPIPESSRKLRIIPASIVRLFFQLFAPIGCFQIAWQQQNEALRRQLVISEFQQSSFSNFGKVQNILCEDDFDFSYQRLRAVPRFEKEGRSNCCFWLEKVSSKGRENVGNFSQKTK